MLVCAAVAEMREVVERSTAAGSGRRLQGVPDTAVYDGYAPGVTINAIDVGVLVSVVACRTLALCHHCIILTALCRDLLLIAWASAFVIVQAVPSWIFSLSSACILCSGLQGSDISPLQHCMECFWCCRSMLISVLHVQQRSPSQFSTLSWDYVRSMTAWRHMALR